MPRKAKRKPEVVNGTGEYLPKIRVNGERKRTYYAGLDKWREVTGIKDLGVSAFIRDALDRRCKELLG
jgi:hypothetical protein